MVVAGKGHHNGLGADRFQIGRTQGSVVQVAPPRLHRGPKTHEFQAGSQAAADDSQTGMALADVVKQCGPGQRPIAGAYGQYPAGRFQPMALVGDRLLPEEVALAGPEQGLHFSLFAGRQWSRRKYFEESTGQMFDTTGEVLHSPTTSNRNRMGGPMSLPKPSRHKNTRAKMMRIP